jgi:uncharacterized protein (TIGR02271 family)
MVRTGNEDSFLPLVDADWAAGRLTVPFDKNKVQDAPHVNSESGHLEVSNEEELYRYYGLNHAGGYRDEAGQGAGYAEAGMRATGDAAVDRVRTDVERSRASADDAAMVLSEERLKVGTERQAVSRVRLRKYIVTEQRTITVPVRREEVRLEQEAITETTRDAALSGPNFSDGKPEAEAAIEMVLYEERPVVHMEIAPVERVRLFKEQVTENRLVTEKIRKEQLETEGLVDDSGTERR